jgi:mannose/fructose/N-acetylgalactosamine-specific phosphotransferase system component IID
MYSGLLHLHNVLRWVILILLLISLVQSFTKNGSIQKTSLWLLIAAHITLILGLFQYFNNEAVGFHMIENLGGFGNVMKDSFARFWVVEHITAMILAIVFITLARGKVKKQNLDTAKWFYLVALILILAAVPWPFREGIGRAWFPGM